MKNKMVWMLSSNIKRVVCAVKQKRKISWFIDFSKLCATHAFNDSPYVRVWYPLLENETFMQKAKKAARILVGSKLQNF